MRTGTCIVLAGGLGTRLRSVVPTLPKCMAPVAAQPFLYYLLHYLSRQGIVDIILSVGYRHELIMDWCREHAREFRIRFAIEHESLGTGGAVQLALASVSEKQVFILNGDTYFDVELQAMESAHFKKGADLSMALKSMTGFERYGSVETAKDGRITAFREKQFLKKGLINGGIYLLDVPAFQRLIFPDIFSLEKDYLEKQVSRQKIYGFVSKGYFIDIGIPEDYQKAQAEFTKLLE